MKAVLTFHAIDHVHSPLSCPPTVFKDMLDAMIAASVPIRPLDELLDPATEDGISITFDDGLSSVHDAALPILRDLRLPAHLFLPTRFVGTNSGWPGQPSGVPYCPMMDWDQLSKLAQAGVRIESHTATHPDLRALSDSEIVAQLGEADETIEARFGRRPQYFAYPYGHHDERTRAIVGTRYAAAFSTRLDYLGGEDDLMALPRLDSHYLRSPQLCGRLFEPRARAYIALRHVIRRIRNRY